MCSGALTAADDEAGVVVDRGGTSETHSVEPGVTDGRRFMELLAATVLAVPLAAGRELLLRMW